MRFSSIAAAFVLGGALAGAAVGTIPWFEAALGDRPALLVDGFVPPERSELTGWLALRAEKIREREAHLALPDALERVSFSELGLELDVAATLAAIEHADVPQSAFRKIYRRYRPDPQPVDVPLAFRFDAQRAARTVEQFRARLHVDPENARLDLDGHRNVPDVPGRELDVGATVAGVASGGREADSVFIVQSAPLQAAVTSEMLSIVDVARSIATYETDFARHAGPRAKNIRSAAGYLDGIVLGPGEVLSFNQVVGPRTEARGFTWAPVIVADEMEPGLGGGVCQVASTLHAAAVYGGLEVLQRRSHSRPSGYTPLGLDATVIYGEVDLKLKNPYDTPVILHAYLPTKTTVRVELLGREPESKVEHTYGVRESEEFVRRVLVKEEMAAGEQRRKQKGIKGYDVVSTVTRTRADGTTDVHHYSSRYWPVPEIYWVGPGTDLRILPGLPEGASHVEMAGPDEPPESDHEPRETDGEPRETDGERERSDGDT